MYREMLCAEAEHLHGVIGAQTAGQAEGLGFSEQPSASIQAEDSDEEEEGLGVSSEAPASYTPAVARQ